MALQSSTGKIAIIGAGAVGSTTAYTLMLNGLVQEIVLVDKDHKKAAGEAMDIAQSTVFARPGKVLAGDFQDCQGADIVIITAGAKRMMPGETRLDLAGKNVDLFSKMIPRLASYCKESIFLIVSNPVDILTYATVRFSGLPADKIIGSGTVLDTLRFRHLMGVHYGVDPRNVHAYVVGEHGDSEVLAWSSVRIGVVPLEDFFLGESADSFNRWKQEVTNSIKQSAYEIIRLKGATYFAISLALCRIVEAILRDENSILTVSTLYECGGFENICLSVPTIIGRKGIKQTLKMPLTERETEELNSSAEILHRANSDLVDGKAQ